ncbi:MAG: hypothetical protein AAF372_04880, partial [Pseudomonadota bacterium]
MPSVVGQGLPHIEVIALFENKAVLRINQEQILVSQGEVTPQGVRLLEADAHRAIIEVAGRKLTYTLGSTVFNAATEETQSADKEI